MTLTVRDRVAMALTAGALLALAGAGWLLLLAPAPTGAGGLATTSLSALASAPASVPASEGGGELVVDVQGGVVNPGVVVLPATARVADAVEAAGGFSEAADTLAAASALNLAAPLTDGAQVYVPLIGVAAGVPPAAGGTGTGGTGGTGGGGGGLVNLNTATPEQLEALPGIGPVTVQKIVAARAERPFATLEELVERDVMNNGQLEDIRALVTL